MKTRAIKGYGWKPELPDGRDFMMQAPAALVPIPAAANLIDNHMPPVYNQGDTASCTGNASLAGFEYVFHKQTGAFLNGSRLFAYYNARVLEGDPESDAGAQIRDVLKGLANIGLCTEVEWPFIPVNVRKLPSTACYAAAITHKELQYTKVTQTGYYLRHCLGVLGLPVIFGFSVYESFQSKSVDATGIGAMPKPHEDLIGGHAVILVGYDDNRRTYTVRNSWGSTWGQKGYFTLPYDYVHSPSLAKDFWAIQLVG